MQCFSSQLYVDEGIWILSDKTDVRIQVGIGLMLAENELVFQQMTQVTLVNVLGWINVVCTCTLLVLVCARYRIQRKIYQMQHRIPSGSWGLGELGPGLLIELVVCMFMIPPMLNFSVPVHEWRNFVDESEDCPDGLVNDDGSCYFVYQYRSVTEKSF